MNLIEKLGLEECKAIVDGAPDWAKVWNTHMKQYTNGFIRCSSDVYLHDIRTAIAEHDQHWYGQSEEKELEQYSLLQQEKIEGGAALVGDFTAIQEQLQTELNNCSKKDSSEISPLTGVIER